MADHYDQRPWLKQYDPHVPANIKYPELTFWESIKEAFQKFPKRKALWYMGTPFTFGQLDAMSNRFAALLQKAGINKGDIVGVNLPNLPAYFVATLGVQKAGCVLSGVSPLLTEEELKYQLKDSRAKAIVTLDALFPRIKRIVSETELKLCVFTSILDYIPQPIKTLAKLSKKVPTGKVETLEGREVWLFTDVMKKLPADVIEVKVGPDDTCAMQYTGGTTGLPKGAELTHRNLVSQMIQVTTWLDTPVGEQVGLSAMPLFHIAGLVMGLAMFSKAVTQVAVPNPRDLKFIIKWMKKTRPHLIGNVPVVFLELMKQPAFRSYDFSGVQYFCSGAAPFPPEYIKEFENIVGANKLVEVYGLTETSAIVTAGPLFGKKKPGSVGLPISDTDIKIVDTTTGEPVPFGEPGEILIRGPQVFTKGYFGKPEETAKVLKDGWFHTGDIGQMDEEGYLFVVDRLKDMVNVSGYKVYTRQLDDIICEFPDVDTGASVGIPDPNRPGSEMVASAIVLKPGIEQSEEEKKKITEYLRSRVAPYKVPKKIVFMDKLPTSAIGKVLKRELRSQLTESAKK